MGKPTQSNQQQLTMSSSSSIFSGNKPKSISSHKKILAKKKRHRRTKTNIRKVFDGLRNESTTSIETEDATVIYVDTPDVEINKRKRKEDSNNLKRKRSASVIIITEDDDLKSTTPLKQPPPLICSTPISKKSNTLITSNIPVPKTNNNTTLVQNLNEEINNLTREVNRDSYITIDLTTDSLNCSSISRTCNKTVDDTADCTVVSVSNTSLSMSGESDITVLNMTPSKREARKQMKSIFNGISKMGANERNVMLKYVVKSIFNGCNLPDDLKQHLETAAQSTHIDSVEDTYIKENILGQASSRNSIGSNIYNPMRDPKNKTGLRMIVIDGSNVAMEHGKGRQFNVKALKICIDYFLRRGHVVKAFVPRFRCKAGKSTDPKLLMNLGDQGLVVFTPAREVEGRMITSYDDRFIVQCAAEFDGVIVSGDYYRDLLIENPRWRTVIERRLLPFTWVNDMIMFPRDPLGRNGPTLEQFLRH